MIQSQVTRRFWAAFHNPPPDVQKQAVQAYRIFRSNPSHPGLQFKKLEGEENLYSVRIGRGYRALGIMRGSRVLWYWIGGHADYDHLIGG